MTVWMGAELAAQMAGPRPNTYRATGQGAAAPRLISPEVHADRRITFRLKAPGAQEVALLFRAWYVKPQAMQKDGAGVWSITVGPVEPEIYTYAFSVDGARVIDISNPKLKTGARGLDASEVEVAGTPARFDEVQAVAHGAIHVRSYMSTPLKRLRGLYIYLPPGYDGQRGARLPVLYLRHGSGDNESNWSDDGRAGVILENLLAQKKARPMMIVMMNGDTDQTWAGGSGPEGMRLLEQELLTDIIPFVEKNYRVKPGRLNRAVAGLSMGGGQAFTIGLRNLQQFAYVGEFSSGLVSAADFDLEKHLPGFLGNSENANRQLALLYLSCGEADPRINGQRNLSDLLKSRGVRHEFFATPGGHEWKVWRHSLADLLPRLF